MMLCANIMQRYNENFSNSEKRIGDVLTSTIILEALKERFPNAELHYLVYENSYAVVKNNKFIDKIVVLDEKSRKGKLAFLAFLFKIRKENMTQ